MLPDSKKTMAWTLALLTALFLVVAMFFAIGGMNTAG
jgi:hypothetical protein